MTDTTEVEHQPSLLDELPPCHCCGGTGRETHAHSIENRPGDPATSAAAGDTVRDREGGNVRQVRKNTHRHRMLYAYKYGAATDEVAASRVKLDRQGVCYWKRASELRQAGYIEWTGQTALGSAGSQRQTCRITVEGVAKLTELGVPVVPS